MLYLWLDGFVREMAYQPITVRDEDIDDLQLNAARTGLLHERVSAEGIV